MSAGQGPRALHPARAGSAAFARCGIAGGHGHGVEALCDQDDGEHHLVDASGVMTSASTNGAFAPYWSASRAKTMMLSL